MNDPMVKCVHCSDMFYADMPNLYDGGFYGVNPSTLCFAWQHFRCAESEIEGMTGAEVDRYLEFVAENEPEC